MQGAEMRLHQFSLRTLLLMMAYYCVLFAAAGLLIGYNEPQLLLPLALLLLIVPPLSLLPAAALAQLFMLAGFVMIVLLVIDIPESFNFTSSQNQLFENLTTAAIWTIIFAFLLSVRYSAQKGKYFAELREAWLTAFPFWRK